MENAELYRFSSVCFRLLELNPVQSSLWILAGLPPVCRVYVRRTKTRVAAR